MNNKHTLFFVFNEFGMFINDYHNYIIFCNYYIITGFHDIIIRNYDSKYIL